MIRQQLMGLGRFSFQFKATTPKSVRSKAHLWGVIAITPQRLSDTSLDNVSVLAAACYSGRSEGSEPKSFEIHGESSLVYLGDGDQPPRGGLLVGFPILPLPPKTWQQFVTNLFANAPRVGGLTLGSFFSPPATVITGDAISDTEPPRQALNRFVKIVNAEYRVNADGSFDSGAPGALWKSGANIDTILMKDAHGTDLDGLTGLNVTRWNVKYSAAEVVPGVYITNAGAPVYTVLFGVYGHDGTTVWYPTKYIEAYGTTSNADATNIATEYFASHAYPGKLTISCSVDTPNIFRHLTANQPGDYVYLYDLETSVRDLANHKIYNGQSVWPMADHRIIEVNSPIQAGMGVYHIASVTNEVTDLSDYIAWETGDTELVLSTVNPLTLRETINGTGQL